MKMVIGSKSELSDVWTRHGNFQSRYEGNHLQGNISHPNWEDEFPFQWMGDVILFWRVEFLALLPLKEGCKMGVVFQGVLPVCWFFVVSASFLLSAMCYVEGISLDDLLQIRCRRLTSRRTKEVLEIFSGVIKFTIFVVNQTMLMCGNFQQISLK